MIRIGIVRTDKWLTLYLAEWKKKSNLMQKIAWHQKMLISPLEKVSDSLPDTNKLQQHFIQSGLILPEEDSHQDINEMLERNYWKVISTHYQQLKQKWSAHDAGVYIFPASKDQASIQSLGGKNGLTIDRFIFLFLTNGLSNSELKAIITHEYHHIFRLSVTEETEESITFLESMIMEGLAELAVSQEVGRDYTAVWTKELSLKQMKRVFKEWLEPHLFTRGRKDHHTLLYGGGPYHVPRWIGYRCGYLIVEQAYKTFNERSIKTVTEIPAEDWLSASGFLK